MLLGTLSASLLGNVLTGKGINKKGKGIKRAGEGIVRAGEGYNKMDFNATSSFNRFWNKKVLCKSI